MKWLGSATGRITPREAAATLLQRTGLGLFFGVVIVLLIEVARRA